MSEIPKTKTDNPCECGCEEIEITQGFVGYMGDKPCREVYGDCPECGRSYNNSKLNERFND